MKSYARIRNRKSAGLYLQTLLVQITTIALVICIVGHGTGFGKILNVPSPFYKTIQSAINNASGGDIVLVADGTYTGAYNKNLDFQGKRITVRSQHGSEFTTIDCENDGRGACFDDGESLSSRLGGFTIEHGYTAYGGGIYCDGASPTISDCIITWNTATWRGGGIYCRTGAPFISDCLIMANYCSGEGGGIFLNASKAQITGCTIEMNTAEGDGTSGCGSGGGVNCYSSAAIIKNCSISGNHAEGDYSGDGYGGGIYCDQSSPSILNCILWDDTGGELHVDSGNPSVNYSDIESTLWPGTNNISANPKFFSVLIYDYVLKVTSPCMDEGDVTMQDGIDWSSLFPAYGQHNGPEADMGAYGGPGNVGWLN